MAAQKRPSQRHGSKYLASASTMDHARHGFLPRHRDSGFLDSLGRFFGGDRGVPKRGSGKDTHHAVRTTHYGSLPQKAQHGRAQDENPVVHFFKSIVRTVGPGAPHPTHDVWPKLRGENANTTRRNGDTVTALFGDEASWGLGPRRPLQVPLILGRA
uniref:Myelin basic protein n=1 Tax=Rousettus aegyptiacus TaxID=9407 RepID=A0A7J8DJB9_ROUAE|nr:myelin basic protein [Rousettus aegyptiacus]